MRVICPNNKEHKKFVTVAHVMQDWVVDENGYFLECIDECSQVVHGPDKDNCWNCEICGADAIIVD